MIKGEKLDSAKEVVSEESKNEVRSKSMVEASQQVPKIIKEPKLQEAQIKQEEGKTQQSKEVKKKKKATAS